MKKSIFTKLISLLLIFTLAISFGGCKGPASSASALDLMEGIVANKIEINTELSDKSAEFTDFAVRLLKAANEGQKNTLISPLSVLYALAMTANGAEGKTRQELEAAFGMSVEELNIFLYSYLHSLSQNSTELKLANSIWINSDCRFTANQEFLQTNADYYNAEFFTLPFDKSACDNINNWISKKTDKLIKNVLDEIPAEAVMYLINTVLFDAQWKEIYTDNQVIEASFTTEDAQILPIELMTNTERCYIKGEKLEGFCKPYAGDRFAFVALLPEKGTSIDEIISSLDGKTLFDMLKNRKSSTIMASIPKYKTEFSADLVQSLKKMDVTDAFDFRSACFDSLGKSTAGNIFINRIIHKTFISVAEKGTKAGAATIIEANDTAAMLTKTICLDRPFIYMLIDCENHLPFFIGTMMNPAK